MTIDGRVTLADYLTINQCAQLLGAGYPSAHRLASAGLLGKPITIGCQLLYPRAIAERAIQRRLDQRKRGGPRAPLMAAV